MNYTMFIATGLASSSVSALIALAVVDSHFPAFHSFDNFVVEFIWHK